MRVLTSLLVVAALCPLSACYVGNTPPTSRRADAGTPDAGAPRCDREFLCGNSQCGRAWSLDCAPVDCGSCGAGYTCQEGLGRCEYTGPLWALRVVSARIERCDTSWDSCRNVAPPFCSPTLPDPFVLSLIHI